MAKLVPVWLSYLPVSLVKHGAPGSYWVIFLANCSGVSCQQGALRLEGMRTFGLLMNRFRFRGVFRPYVMLMFDVIGRKSLGRSDFSTTLDNCF